MTGKSTLLTQKTSTLANITNLYRLVHTSGGSQAESSGTSDEKL
jgi:hypothetical protein